MPTDNTHFLLRQGTLIVELDAAPTRREHHQLAFRDVGSGRRVLVDLADAELRALQQRIGNYLAGREAAAERAVPHWAR